MVKNELIFGGFLTKCTDFSQRLTVRAIEPLLKGIPIVLLKITE